MAKREGSKEMRPIKGKFTRTEFLRLAKPLFDNPELIFEQYLDTGKIRKAGTAGIDEVVLIFSWRSGPG